MKMAEVAVVTVHYNTPVLLWRLLRSVRRFYPRLPVTVIDGSDRRLDRLCSRVIGQSFGADVDVIGHNIHHGPGLDRGIRRSSAEFVVVVDTDVELIRPGFIEAALNCMGDFGVGGVQWVDGDGKDVNEGEGTPYLHPRLAMIRRDAYLAGPTAIRHGAPFLPVMQHLQGRGLSELPEMDRFFVEDAKGTVRRTGGYHLAGEPTPSRLYRLSRSARSRLNGTRRALRRLIAGLSRRSMRRRR